MQPLCSALTKIVSICRPGVAQNDSNGAILVIFAGMIFGLVALVVKKNPLPTTVATEARFFVGWIMSVVFMIGHRSDHALEWFGPAKIRWSLILRSILQVSFLTLWWAALPLAPLGDCIAIMYCAPLLTVLWSGIVLGEQMLTVFPIQALLATTGMCFIVQPSFLLSSLNLAPANTSGGEDYTLAVAATFVSSIMPVVTRQTKEASWIEVEHAANFLAVFVLNPCVFFGLQFAKGGAVSALPSVSVSEVALVILASLASSVGVALQTCGYQMAEPGKASMFMYLEVPFAYLLQLIGTQSPISTNSIFGAILVLLACLLGAGKQFRSMCQSTDLEEGQIQQDVESAEELIPRASDSESGLYEPFSANEPLCKPETLDPGKWSNERSTADETKPEKDLSNQHMFNESIRGA